MRRNLLAGVACLLSALAVGASGCKPAASMKMTGASAALAHDDGSAGFLDRIASGRIVSENDAMRGMLMLLEGKDACKTFKGRVEKLTRRSVADPSWDHDAGRPLTKGKLAYMVCQACKIRGGVILTLTGPSRRYCLRELQFRGIMSDGMGGAKVTGMEFVAVMTRADTYLQTGKLPMVLTSEQEY